MVTIETRYFRSLLIAPVTISLAQLIRTGTLCVVSVKKNVEYKRRFVKISDTKHSKKPEQTNKYHNNCNS